MMTVSSNLNDLNSTGLRAAPIPDILQNILGRGDAGSNLVQRSKSTYDGTRSDQPSTNRPMVGADFNFKCGCNVCRKGLKRPSKSRQRFMRGLCCLGWIFCCPMFTLTWAMRTAPVDRQDLQEDDCYPCFSTPS